MNIFNAFVVVPEMANNEVNAIAKFGELSVLSKTFSRDIRNYVDREAFPGIEVVSFNFHNESSETVTNPDKSITDTALQIGNYLVTQHKNNQIPMVNNKKALETSVQNTFKTINDVEINAILDGEKTGKRFIDRIKYDFVVGSTVWRCNLWFSDAAFRKQYPLYEIEVIPPIADLNRLVDSRPNVIEALQSVTIDYTINRMTAITQNNPNTTEHVYTARWTDQSKPDLTYDTKWTLVIYGNAGNDQDAIKDAIREYLTGNAPNQPWDKIFPDLFSESEFLIIPFWNLLSTPIKESDDGLYSSIVYQSEITSNIDRVLPRAYASGREARQYKDDNLAIVSSSYRNMQMMAIGNPNNKGAKTKFREMFPDYMAVSTDKPDFSRMSGRTQDFVLLLLECLELARNFTIDTPLEANFSKTVKGSREYIGFDFDGYTYYVATRIGFNKEL